MVVEKNTKDYVFYDCELMRRPLTCTIGITSRQRNFLEWNFFFDLFVGLCSNLYYCVCDVAFGLLTTAGGAGVS